MQNNAYNATMQQDYIYIHQYPNTHTNACEVTDFTEIHITN